MSTIKTIQQIAKTAIITEKLDKLNKELELPVKTPIQSLRITAYQTGDSAKGVGAGGNAPPLTGAVNSGGSIVSPTPSQSLPPPSQNNNTTNTPTDLSIISHNNTGKALPTLGGRTSDMSGGVSGGITPSSMLSDIAKQGIGDTALEAILATIDAMPGLTDAQKETMKAESRQKYWNEQGKEPGTHNAKDLADSTNSPRTALGGSNITLSYTGQTWGLESLTAVVGFDIDGNTDENGNVLAVMVRLIDQVADTASELSFPTPAGWASPDDGTYREGFVWTLISGATRYFAPTFAGLQLQREVLDGTVCRSSTVGPPYVNYAVNGESIVFTDPNSLTGGTVYDYQADAGIVGIGEYGIVPCGTYAGDGCPLLAENETAWPKTSSYVLSSIGGVFLGHAYDQEVPLVWRLGSSVAEIALGDGVNVIDDRRMKIQPIYRGGKVITVISAGDDIEQISVLDSGGILLYRGSDASQLDSLIPR